MAAVIEAMIIEAAMKLRLLGVSFPDGTKWQDAGMSTRSIKMMQIAAFQEASSIVEIFWLYFLLVKCICYSAGDSYNKEM